MKVFLSWSGDLSHDVALILSELLPSVIQRLDPYVSSEDIDKGARWFSDVAGQLEQSDFGIICLTRANMTAPWVLFEAGALSKRLERSRVAPFLVDLAPPDLEGPLAQFQATTIDLDEMLKLVHSLDSAMGDDALGETVLQRSFDKWWPELKERLDAAVLKPRQTIPRQAERSEREILVEILEHTRSLSRALPETTEAYADLLPYLELLLSSGSGKPHPERDSYVYSTVVRGLAQRMRHGDREQAFRKLLEYLASSPPRSEIWPGDEAGESDGERVAGEPPAEDGKPHN